jgi:hypothetical protein
MKAALYLAAALGGVAVAYINGPGIDPPPRSAIVETPGGLIPAEPDSRREAAGEADKPDDGGRSPSDVRLRSVLPPTESRL